MDWTNCHTPTLKKIKWQTLYMRPQLYHIYIPLSLVTVFSFPAQPNMHECQLQALEECQTMSFLAES